MSSRPFTISFPLLSGGRGNLSVGEIWGSVFGLNPTLLELIIRVFSGESGDSWVGGLFTKAPLIWALEVTGVIAPHLTFSSQWSVQGFHGVTCIVHALTLAHTHLQVAKGCAYISHPPRYDQFHLLACVQLSVQLLQVSEGSLLDSPWNPSFFPSLLNRPDVDQ